MPESGQQFYKEEDAEQILRLAASFTTPLGGAMSRDRLLETAAELGITPEAVAMAEQQLASSRTDLAERAQFDQRIRRDFYGHLASYVIVNGFLCTINLISGGYFWAVWPLLGWGIGLAFSVVETFFRNSESYQEEFDKWRAKRQRVQTTDHSVVEPNDFIIERFIQIRRSRGREIGKLELIKFVRENGDMSLKDAKDAVDSYAYRNPGVVD